MKKLMNDKDPVKHLSAFERMGSANCICTDKTGTLTTNHMVVDKIWICEKTTDIKGSESADKLKTEISDEVLNILLQAIFQNTSEVVKDKDGKRNILGMPTEAALLEFGLLSGGDFDAQRSTYNILKVEPSNLVPKKISVLVGLPDGGVRAFCKGASEIVLQMCDKIIDSSGTVVDLPEEKAKNVSDVINGFASEALRTLCLAVTSIPENGYIAVCMVTVDNINTARAIAKECGILTEDGVAIEGPDFCNLSAEEMKDVIPRIQVAKENADVIIMDDNFATIVNVAKWGCAIYRNIQKFVQFQLTVNIVALVINFVSACITGSAPLTAVQLLWVNLIMDGLGALVLATEPPNDGLMNRPPFGRKESFITKPMWRNIFGQSLYQLIVLAVLNFDGKRKLRFSGPDSTIVLYTLIFNSFVFCQVKYPMHAHKH